MKIGLVALGLLSSVTHAETAAFRWGAASAAYQVEGAANTDGKGRSVWDLYLDDHHLAGPGISGQVAINFYERNQYLKDIALLKQMGLNSYRFSVSWPRIMPDGLGPVNPAAVAHYRQFIADLKAAGIQPLLTLYHWDMPESLAAAGGWENRESVKWFRRYAEVIFANFADQVDLYALVNEPSVERATKTMAEARLRGEAVAAMPPILPDKEHLQGALKTFNHIMLASAEAKKVFDEKGYKGRLGLALPLFPTLTASDASNADKNEAVLADGVLNRWFLDAIYKGEYPADILDLVRRNKMSIDVQPGDAAAIQAAHFGFLGINYYAPFFIKHEAGSRSDYAPEVFIPVSEKVAFNGAVRPDQFKALLERVKNTYGNPTIFITENGAGFPDEDKLIDGEARDVNRCRYLVDHIRAMQEAIKEGVDVQGYHVWSSHDNLEWLSGYQSRFGLIYVDYDTQQRTPKLSSRIYARLIKGQEVTLDACAKY